jgi:biotin carboxyl carrier protein
MTLTTLKSDVTGTVCTLEAEVGAKVATGDVLLVLESMKMEIPVTAPISGKLSRLTVDIGNAVSEGQVLAVIES